jgi:hypothetical protein
MEDELRFQNVLLHSIPLRQSVLHGSAERGRILLRMVTELSINHAYIKKHEFICQNFRLIFYCSKNAANAEISAWSCGNPCEVSLTSFSSRSGSR